MVNFGRRLSGISYASSSTTSTTSRSDDDDDDEEMEMEMEGIMCEFEDGSTAGPYDIVVGCDGINSAVRRYVNDGEVRHSSSLGGEKEVKGGKGGGGGGASSSSSTSSSAIYSGLRITFAIRDGNNNNEDDEKGAANDVDVNVVDGCQFNQYFGNGAYALTSTYGTGKGGKPARGAFLVYADEDYVGPFRKSRKANDRDDGTSSSSADAPPDENADWTQDRRASRDRVSKTLGVLRAAGVPGGDDVADVVRMSDRSFDLGVYLHNPFSWNGWVREVPRGNNDGSWGGVLSWLFGKEGTKRFVVTTGDASHAMPPFLGQGANQALQDSCTLAAKIIEYNRQIQRQSSGTDDPSVKPDLKALLKEYESRRWLPTTSITAKAAFLGYLEVGPGLFANFRAKLVL
ncbi:hypothetical protein ACHAW5_009962 [Stephanodiscus triporus]|uniref:FAD-binding domain-containing protein n=1 Tax=Stephanodiscus triporus TaxID=2934178 RepID=A0ABD3NYP3_9STRA